ncbi:MAG: macro domain-containing protein [Anaerovoracaceae bacterium]|jgi:O-acetyl-ADP-ribose deacetylase (regulator of RNase III)
MPLEIIRNDITKMKVDVIVNAANSRLEQGGGVCGAIFAAAGADKLREECRKIGYCATGNVVMTEGYDLPTKKIIHAVGPIWSGGQHNEEELLTSCYTKALKLAHENNLTSIAFPLISSGIFGYPKDQALQVAIHAIGTFLLKHDMMVYLVIFDKKSYELSEKLFSPIAKYIDDNYVDTHIKEPTDWLYEVNRQIQEEGELDILFNAESPDYLPTETKSIRSLKDVVNELEESFSQMLLRLIDEKGQKDSHVYKRANIDRKLFSKIRSNPNYQPSKNTALALAIALELSLDETKDLLARAGYALSPSSKLDLIIEYFIKNNNYNIFEINEALFAFDQQLLGVS